MTVLKSTKFWIAVIAALLVVSAAAAYALSSAAGGARSARVYLDGELLRTIDLDRVRESDRFTVEDGGGGVNVVEVEPGRIRVSEANCPDGVCVRRGWSSDGAAPIVCLPHRLVIEVTDADAEIDAA